MFICKDCGAVFEEPDVTYDDPSPSGVALPSGAYEYEFCPECGSDDIEVADECASCGEYIIGKTLCDDCKSWLVDRLVKLREDLGITQDEFEEAICEIFEW